MLDYVADLAIRFVLTIIFTNSKIKSNAWIQKRDVLDCLALVCTLTFRDSDPKLKGITWIQQQQRLALPEK
jgi:hypothetical protein